MNARPFSMLFGLSMVIFLSSCAYNPMGAPMWNSSKKKVYACYAQEHPTPESPFYALVEAEQFYNEKNYDKALASLDSMINTYSAAAKVMQGSLTEYPWESKEKIFRYGELNAVATALVLKALIYYKLEDYVRAEAYLKEQRTDYTYAQCWNPDGWFVKLERMSEELLTEIARKKTK